MSEEYLFEYKSIFSPLEVIKLHSKQETHFAQGGTVLVPPNLIAFFNEIHKLIVKTRKLKDILLTRVTRSDNFRI